MAIDYYMFQWSMIRKRYKVQKKINQRNSFKNRF